jgi:ABC-type transport system involved in multi-copper enzyme maturation permease subunit
MTMNPVLGRELRERVRSGRAFVVITVYLALLSVVLWAVYSAESEQQVDPFGTLMVTEAAAVGRTVFEWLVFMMFVLVLFLVPGLTSGAISGERERQTLVPLQITLLRPRSIVAGKLGASLAFLALLLVVSTPLVSVAYLLGGMAFTQVLGAMAGVLASGVLFAALTIACSSLFRRTQPATVVAYGLALFLSAGTWVGWAMWSATTEDPTPWESGRAPTWVLTVNPLALTADVVGSPTGAGGGPFTAMRESLYPSQNQDEQFMEMGGVMMPGPRGGVFMEEPMGVGRPDDPAPDDAEEAPFWRGAAIAMSVLTLVALVVATRMLRTPAGKER